jgi:hypothetical protein
VKLVRRLRATTSRNHPPTDREREMPEQAVDRA